MDRVKYSGTSSRWGSRVQKTLVGAVVGLAWEFLCRVVPIVLFCAVVLEAVVGVLWLIGRMARALGGK